MHVMCTHSLRLHTIFTLKLHSHTCITMSGGMMHLSSYNIYSQKCVM